MTPLEKRLGYEFRETKLLEQALTHKSYAFENRMPETHNEKLEFLGDAVLDLILGEYLLENFPLDQEGALSKKRASLVNEEALARVALALELPAQLRLGKGELQTAGSQKPRLLASAMEALAGALYMDAGFEQAKLILRREFRPWIEGLDPDLDFAEDHKTRFQEWAQKSLKATPTYELAAEDGPAHDRIFTVVLKIRDDEIARGTGRSKKAAEQQAAKEALAKVAGGNG